MYWGTSRWSSTDIMEAYSVARQFNQIPPIAEQAEYHLLQREKVELQMPELYQKIGIYDRLRSASGLKWHPLMSLSQITVRYKGILKSSFFPISQIDG